MAIDDLLAPVGTRFSCKMCGTCCHQDVYVTEGDLERIEQSFPSLRTKVQWLRQNCGIPGIKAYSLLVNAGHGMQCIFLVDGRCSVHASKPLQCRLYPFFPVLVDTIRSFIADLGRLSSCEGLQGKSYVFSVDQQCMGLRSAGLEVDWAELVRIWEQHKSELSGSMQ